MEPNGPQESVPRMNSTRGGFDEFWVGNRDRLCRALTLTVGDTLLAADAIDEAMARAYQRWDHVSSLEAPAGWVFRVGLNWSRSFLRRARRQPPAWLSPAFAQPAEITEPSIDAALAALPIEQRAVVVCRHLLQMSEADTAAALGVPPGTVKSRLSRATSKLSDSLSHLDPKEVQR